MDVDQLSCSAAHRLRPEEHDKLVDRCRDRPLLRGGIREERTLAVASQEFGRGKRGGRDVGETPRSNATTCSMICQGRNWNKRNRQRIRKQARERYWTQRAMRGKSAGQASVMAEFEVGI